MLKVILFMLCFLQFLWRKFSVFGLEQWDRGSDLDLWPRRCHGGHHAGADGDGQRPRPASAEFHGWVGRGRVVLLAVGYPQVPASPVQKRGDDVAVENFGFGLRIINRCSTFPFDTRFVMQHQGQRCLLNDLIHMVRFLIDVLRFFTYITAATAQSRNITSEFHDFKISPK